MSKTRERIWLPPTAEQEARGIPDGTPYVRADFYAQATEALRAAADAMYGCDWEQHDTGTGTKVAHDLVHAALKNQPRDSAVS